MLNLFSLKVNVEKFASWASFFKRTDSGFGQSHTDLMTMTNNQILGLAYAAIQKKVQLKWYFKSGDEKVFRTVRVLNDYYVLVEEKNLWDNRARLLDVREVLSVSFI